jgi:hypothetical protein
VGLRVGVDFRVWRVAAKIWNKQLLYSAKEVLQLRVGTGLITPHCKIPACYKILQRASDLTGSCEMVGGGISTLSERILD